MNKTFKDFNLKNHPASADKIVGYDEITGEEIRIPVSSFQSVKGEKGDSIRAEYSSDTLAWHYPYQSNDIYMRIRIGNGAWTDPLKIDVDSGGDENYIIVDNIDDIANKYIGLQAYNRMEKNSIELISSLIPFDYNNFSMTLLDDYIFFFGGIYNGYYTDKIFRYDITNNIMEELNEILPVEVIDVGSIVVDGDIYILGGQTIAGPNKKILKYEISSGTIQMLSENGVSLVPILTTDGTDIYIMNYSDFSDEILKYEISSNEISLFTTLPVMIEGVSFCYFDGNLYVIGGGNDNLELQDTIYKVDSSGKVNLLSLTLNEKCKKIISAVIDNKIFMLYGENHLSKQNSLYIFDPNSETLSMYQEVLPLYNENVVKNTYSNNFIYYSPTNSVDIFQYNTSTITHKEGLYIYRSDGWHFIG